jgi:uncharacterized protein
MHPAVCRFVSDAFYESRLRSIEACAERTTSDGVGVRWLAIEHEGNRVDSEQEADVVANEIERLVGQTFTDVGRDPRPINYGDVMVVAPYNAQVRLHGCRAGPAPDQIRRRDGGRALQRAGAPPPGAAAGAG